MSVTDVNLEAIDPKSLTPKQRVVYDELEKGKKAPEIAKKMKISPAGVYGHIRALSKHVDVPEPKASSNGASKSKRRRGRPASNGSASKSAPVVVNNQATVAGGYESAVDTVAQSLVVERELHNAGEQQISDLRDSIKSAEAQIAETATEVERRQARIAALTRAQEDLTV